VVKLSERASVLFTFLVDAVSECQNRGAFTNIMTSFNSFQTSISVA
jgi:hypothetical protein